MSDIIAKERNNKPTPFGKYGKLHVEGGKLKGEKGDDVQLRGISTHNISNYPQYVSEETLTTLVDEWGISVFRLAMYCGEADGFDGYATGDDAHRLELEALIVKAVKAAAKLGFYVLVDWHVLLEQDPNLHKDAAIKFFDKICGLLKDYDNVIYEICNEPNGDHITWPVICVYANQVIPVIRAKVPDSVILVGTPCWSQQVDKAAAAPLPYPNLMYVLHFYADTHRDELRNVLEEAAKAGLPLFVSEFGCCNAAGDGEDNKEEADKWIALLNKYGISFIAWNLSNKNEASAFILPDCEKISGWNDDELNGCAKLVRGYIKA